MILALRPWLYNLVSRKCARSGLSKNMQKLFCWGFGSIGLSTLEGSGADASCLTVAALKAFFATMHMTTYDRVPSGPGTSSLAFSPQPGCLGPRWSVSVQGSCLRNNTALAFCEVLQNSWQGCNPQMRTLPCGPPQVLPQLADLA